MGYKEEKKEERNKEVKNKETNPNGYDVRQRVDMNRRVFMSFVLQIYRE